jgi:hemerythrin
MDAPQKLYWEDRFSTGDANLDFQHKYIFETFNKLSDAIADESAGESINVILGRLKFYSDWHFGKEEECMDRYKCPAAQVNKNAHDAFRVMFNKYYDEYVKTGGSLDLVISVHKSLSDWLVNHILGVDISLYPCIHGQKKGE